MTRAFILYYLSIKPTHGYEIQKFLQVSGTEQWAKIQSGSIYYALTKLEKEKLIEVLREERTGSRVRKIYQITEAGRAEMQNEMRQVISEPLWPVSTMKFFTAPYLNTLSKDMVIQLVTGHIAYLQEQKEYWAKWKSYKVDGKSPELLRLSFDIAVDGINSQIQWHEELLKGLDMYIDDSRYMENVIKSFDFNESEEGEPRNDTEQKIHYMQQVKEEIAKITKNPQPTIENLDKIIEDLKKELTSE